MYSDVRILDRVFYTAGLAGAESGLGDICRLASAMHPD